MENHLFKCDVKSFHYAYPRFDSIGYDNIQTAISIPRKFFISAHAPSKIYITPKNDIKIFINGGLNRTTGLWSPDIKFNIYHNNEIISSFTSSLEYRFFYLKAGQQYLFEIESNYGYGAHTLWNFFYDDPYTNDDLLLYFKLLKIASNVKLNNQSDYVVFIQTCHPRKKMALNLVLSLLTQVKILPKKIIIASLDKIQEDQSIIFPENVEIWSGKSFWSQKLSQAGLLPSTIHHIFNGFENAGNPNMWLKYVAPRLCIDEKVLILDDDTLFFGPADELITSSENIVFMEDSGPFYGEKTINYFNTFYQTNKYRKTPPFVCAGAYKLNKKLSYNSNFINKLILESESDMDEQSAVGMEVLDSDYKLLLPPKYHHGGFENQNIDFSKLEFIHMQGKAVNYRDSIKLEHLFKNMN